MKLTYEKDFRSNRDDGRHLSSMAAFTEEMRKLTPRLAYRPEMSTEEFSLWREKVRRKTRELLKMPKRTKQPAPRKVGEVKREGYRVERWELYPDDYSVVPFLILIPDSASAATPAPGVICLPGSIFSKEYLAGEPLLDRPSCGFEKYPERNRMAKIMVENGYVAFAFDNPAIAEVALDTESPNEYGGTSRIHLCFGYSQAGYTYTGVSVFHKLLCLDFMKTLPYVDKDRLAVSAHSLGTEAALALGLLSDDIKAVVFNDFVCDGRVRFVSNTEEDEDKMVQNVGNWHEIPGIWKWFGYQDMLAALAPKYLACNEGGADEVLDVIRDAYRTMGCPERLQITHYPKYTDEANRTKHGNVPRFGLSESDYYEWSNVDAPDHSFRGEPSLSLLKKSFDK